MRLILVMMIFYYRKKKAKLETTRQECPRKKNETDDQYDFRIKNDVLIFAQETDRICNIISNNLNDLHEVVKDIALEYSNTNVLEKKNFFQRLFG